MKKNKLILEIRRRLDLSQRELGKILGITAAAVSHYENNSKSPSPRVALALVHIARELGLPADIEDIYQSVACQIGDNRKL